MEDITKEFINFDKDDVKKEMKRRFRMAWKDPGYCDSQFSQAPIMEQKYLNEWDMSRCMQPERAYKCRAISKGFKINHFSNPFPTPSKEILGENFGKFLQNFEKDFLDYSLRPSKYGNIRANELMEKIERNAAKPPFRSINTVQTMYFGYPVHSTFERVLKNHNETMRHVDKDKTNTTIDL